MQSFSYENKTYILDGETLTIVPIDGETMICQLPSFFAGEMFVAFIRYNERITMKDIEPDDHVFTIEEFRILCENGAFIDSDGTGYYATESQRSGIEVSPSVFYAGVMDTSWTHVVWYNK